MQHNIDYYPSAAEMASDNSAVIPPLLHDLLSCLISPETKQNSISQSIVQATCPRSVVAPLLLGLGLDLDLQHGSENLIIELARFGF